MKRVAHRWSAICLGILIKRLERPRVLHDEAGTGTCGVQCSRRFTERSKREALCTLKPVQRPWRVSDTPGHEPTSPSVVSISVAHADWTCATGKPEAHAYHHPGLNNHIEFGQRVASSVIRLSAAADS
jgi:hypothetical protein